MTRSIVLFDVDGTLTIPRQKIKPEMITFLEELHSHVDIGIVGGSDLPKMQEQLSTDILNYDFIDYIFSENGLVAHHKGTCFHKKNIAQHLGENTIKRLINFCLRYIADLDIPIKRGTFVEYRNGMLNVSPIGRNCSQSERDAFAIYDSQHHILKKMVSALKLEFQDVGLKFSIGGQISFDVFPKGWDKTYCLRFLTEYDHIYFFGDKTHEGGNDYEIFQSPLTEGYTVTSPDDTIRQCKQLFPESF